MNVTEAVAFGAGRLARQPELSTNARRDSNLLLRFVLRCRREDLLANPLRRLSTDEQRSFTALVEAREAGKPMQYITGTQQFWGLDFAVTPAVLIPRPETEHLVEAALALLPRDQEMHVIDVGTGSGAIAIALAHDRPLINFTAIDISPDALAVARANARLHHLTGRVRFVESDLLTKAGESNCDMIISNPPYVAESDRASLTAEVRDHEPATALFAGATGYEVYRRLIPQAARTLRPKGWLLLEIGLGQHITIRDLLAQNEFTAIRFVDDLQGIRRVTIAQKG